MDTQNFNFQDPLEVQSVHTEVTSKTFTARVFLWMTLGLGITGFLAYVFAHTGLITLLFNAGHPTPLFYIAMFSPIALVLLMGFGMNKLSYQGMVFTFLVYSALTGISLSIIFLAYTAASIASVFFITAGMFGAMAFMGYTTSTDLTKFGSLMMMLLFGVIIAIIVNLFLHSDTFDYVISFLCVAIFTGLTAYDVQKIKQIGAQVNGDTNTMGKMAIWGALSLYLDFINLFLALLRIFGNRK